VGWITAIWFPAGAGNISLYCHIQIGSGTHLAFYPMGTRALKATGE